MCIRGYRGRAGGGFPKNRDPEFFLEGSWIWGRGGARQLDDIKIDFYSLPPLQKNTFGITPSPKIDPMNMYMNLALPPQKRPTPIRLKFDQIMAGILGSRWSEDNRGKYQIRFVGVKSITYVEYQLYWEKTSSNRHTWP